MERNDRPRVVASSEAVRVLGGYPGANAAVEAVESDAVSLDRDVGDSGSEWTFYWNVGVESDVAREVTVSFAREVVGRFGPVVSADRREWRWLGAEATPDRRRFRYRFDAGERAFFAFSFPYVLADFEAFWADVGEHPRATRERLTASERGRPVPVVRLGDPGASEHVVLAARHHACEAPASYALEGALSELLDADALDDRCVHAFPLVDLDGVQRGDQGKARVPHDHNRDYGGNALLDDVAPIYRATAAVQAYVRGLEGDLAVALDYHAPFKWGSEEWGRLHDRPFLAADPAAVTPGERRLAELLDEETDRAAGALGFDADQGFGEPGGFAHDTAFASFLDRQGAALSRTLEVPYVGTPDDRVTPASCRGLGRAVARALSRWLV